MKKIIKFIKSIIARFRYENLRNETHVEFHTGFNALVLKYTAETLGIKPLYDLYLPLYNEEVDTLDVIRKSELTAEIDAQDQLRDQLYRGFADTVKGNLNHFDPVKRQAAEKLEVILEHYGNIAAKTLYDETAAIEDLHRELLKQENFLQVATLGLGEWLGQLVQASRNLEGLLLNRVDEIAKRPDINMRSIRKEVDTVFRNILDLLEVQVRVNGPDTNKAFLAELNAWMTTYKDILAQEAGRRHPVHDLAAGDHCVIEPIDVQQYTERAVTPLPKVHYRKEGQPTLTLTFTKDYTLTYKNNVNVGMAEVTVHGIGDYKGKKMATFGIAR
ncbi:MAG: DUF6261 family protein [Prevotellaceae bacterium]|jgi:hypothetical protein|nr:DUF6261 family protein [Prevotellaceae bacterium]